MGNAGSRTLAAPADFRRAVAGLDGHGLRAGTEIGELPSPTQLAPYTHAVSVAVNDDDGDPAASGRLILLHDPDGVDAWEGTFRVVAFGTCEIDTDMAADALLPEVAWSWLTERLAAHGVDYRALGGTVTITSSNRFGDIAGPPRINELELRASWTAETPDTTPHLAAFADFLATAAGLPPEGVAAIRDQGHPFAARRV
jgi:hypothetical protein